MQNKKLAYTIGRNLVRAAGLPTVLEGTCATRVYAFATYDPIMVYLYRFKAKPEEKIAHVFAKAGARRLSQNGFFIHAAGIYNELGMKNEAEQMKEEAKKVQQKTSNMQPEEIGLSCPSRPSRLDGIDALVRCIQQDAELEETAEAFFKAAEQLYGENGFYRIGAEIMNSAFREAARLKAEEYARKGNHFAAAEIFDVLGRHNLWMGEMVLRAAEEYVKAEKYVKAIEIFAILGLADRVERILLHEPHNLDFDNIAELLARCGMRKKAFDYIFMYERKTCDYAGTADLCLRLGFVKEAIEYYCLACNFKKVEDLLSQSDP